jgi:hypothetical protein
MTDMAITFASPTDSTTRLPAGEYIMRLKDIESEASTYRADEERLKFIFAVQSVESIDAYPDDIDEDDDEAVSDYEAELIDNKEHWAWCSNKMGGNATLRKWLTGMLGRTIGKNEVPDPSEVIGKSYKVTLGMVSYTFNGESGEKFDIALIKPYKAKKPRAPKTNDENLAPWEREDDDE